MPPFQLPYPRPLLRSISDAMKVVCTLREKLYTNPTKQRKRS
uniref:Uncharacterized protein n=1 Tax=Anguilla anguilla TaxID=7936 RepID=A0A0E9W478_ANGAN